MSSTIQTSVMNLFNIVNSPWFLLFLHLLIALVNIFGWISKDFCHWNPLRGSITVPFQLIHIGMRLFPGDPFCHIFIESVEFSSIVVSMSVIGRLIVHVHINDLVCKIKGYENADEDIPSVDILNNVNHVAPKSSSNALKKYGRLALNILRPFVGIYFNNIELSYESGGNSCTFHYETVRTSISYRHQVDFSFEYSNLIVSIDSNDDHINDQVVVYSSKHLTTTCSFDRKNRNLNCAVECCSTYVVIDSFSILPTLQLVSNISKYSKPNLKQTKKRFLACFHSFLVNEIDSIPVAAKSENRGFNQLISNFILSIKVKDIGIVQRKYFAVDTSVLFSIRAATISAAFSCESSTNIADSIQNVSIMLFIVEDADGHVCGSTESPILSFTCSPTSNISGSRFLALHFDVLPTTLAIEIQSISNILFLLTELSSILNAWTRSRNIFKKRDTNCLAQQSTQQNDTQIIGRLQHLVITMKSSSELSGSLSNPISLSINISNMAFNYINYSFESADDFGDKGMTLSVDDIFIVTGSEQPSICARIQDVQFSQKEVLNSNMKIVDIQHTNIKFISLSLNTEFFAGVGYVIGQTGGRSPNTRLSQGFTSSVRPISQRTHNSISQVCIGTLDLEGDLSSESNMSQNIDQFNRWEISLKQGMKVNISQEGSQVSSSVYLLEESVDIVVYSPTYHVILAKFFCFKKNRPIALDDNDKEADSVSTYMHVKPLRSGPFDRISEYILATFTTFPSDEYKTRDKRIGFHQLTNIINISLKEAVIYVDTLFLRPLLKSLGTYSSAAKVGRKIFMEHVVKGFGGHGNISYEYLEQSFKGVYSVNTKNIDFVSKTPSFIFGMKIDTYDQRFFHDKKEVLGIQCNNLQFGSISFEKKVNQISFKIESLIAMDLTSPKSLHKVIVCNISDEQVPSNLFELHITNRIGERGIMELRAENLQYVYLQRTTMTMINYFRDFLIKGINDTFNEASMAQSNGNIIEEESTDILECYKYHMNGVFRIGISVRQIEAHIPINGYAADAITIMAEELTFFKSCPKFQEISSDYLQGLYLSRKVWISQIDSITAIGSTIENNFRLKEIVSSLSWLPNQIIMDEITAPSDYPLQASTTLFYIYIENATFCSWCTETPIGEQMNLRLMLSIVPTMLGSPKGLNDESLENETYFDPAFESRNRITVDIATEQIVWTLSQGQYAAIVFMIQQNFSELTEVVPEIWPIPKLSMITLTDRVYGKNPMEMHLPIFSTIPIHIQKGKILFTENTEQYYDLFQKPLGKVPYMSRNILCKSKSAQTSIKTRMDRNLFGFQSLQEFNAVPQFSFHNYHRQKLFSKLSKAYLLRPTNRNVFDSESSPKAFIPKHGDPFLTVLFENLEVDIYRRHYGGGNGIEASALSFILSDQHNFEYSHERERATSDDFGSELSRSSNINDISPESVVFGPKSLSCFNKSKESDLKFEDVYNVKKSKMYRKSSANDAKGKGDFFVETSSDISDDSESDIDFETQETSRVPHIAYHQQGIGNLRRCIVEINDSVAVIQINPILTAIKYFTEPTHLYFQRNLNRILSRKQGPYDFKSSLDVEVHALNTVFCLPNTTAVDGTSALCIHSNFHYTHAWRGYLLSGPGKVSVDIELSLLSVFISPLHEIKVEGAESVIDPCIISFLMIFNVLCRKSDLEQNVNSLAPWMSIESITDSRVSRLHNYPIAERVMAIKIYPSDPNLSKTEQVSFGDTVTKAESKNDLVNESDQNDQLSPRIIQLRVSLQDIAFLVVAIQQLIKILKHRRKRPLVTTCCSYLMDHFHDVDHLPLLTYYIVYTPLSSSWTECDIDLLGDVGDLQIVLRNNTYNITISKCDLTGLQLSYNKSGEKLHGAVGVTVSCWTFNDSSDTWEPVIEPVQMTAVAATDSTEVGTNELIRHPSSDSLENLESNSSFDGKTIGPKVKVDVFSNPVEITLALSAAKSLIRRFRLADVVTSSSALIPPYLIINELGLPLKCSVGIGSQLITSEVISQGQQFPIEIRQLANAKLYTKKMRWKSGNTINNSKDDDDKEHLMNISFDMNGETYESVKPLALDREGITSFEIRKQVSNKRRQNKSSAPNQNEPQRRTSSSNSIEDLPFVLLSMRIKEDGGREIIVRSLLSFKNMTHRVFQLSVRRNDLRADMTIAPDMEWFVPVSLAHPRSSLYMQMSQDRSGWFEALPVLHSLMTQGNWGLPTKLRAELVSCPPEHPSCEGHKANWAVLLRPEARDWKLGSTSKSTIPVKYPNGDPYRAPPASSIGQGINQHESVDGAIMYEDIYNFSRIQAAVSSAGFINSDHYRPYPAQPMTVHIMPPLQLCNIISIPLLYRIASTGGLIMAEGILLPGEIVDLHNLYQLFVTSIYISIRVINYSWTKWTKIFSAKSPFPQQEKTIDCRLSSLNLIHKENDLKLPNIDVYISIREHFLRFSCPIIICNRTGWPLQYCETSSPDLVMPQPSSEPIHTLIRVDKNTILIPRSKIGRYVAKIESRNLYNNRMNKSASIIQDSDTDDEKDSNILSYASTKMSGSKTNLKDDGHPNLPSRISMKAKSSKIKSLFIHLPQDHLRFIELSASYDWTLQDVFGRVIDRVTSNPLYKDMSSYVFLSWEEGASGPRKITDSLPVSDKPATEDDNSMQTGINAAFNTSPSAGLFSTSSKKTTIADIPELIKFSMLVECKSIDVLPFDTSVSAIKGNRIRLCHVSEMNIYNQIQSIRSESDQRDNSFIVGMFSKVKTTHKAQFYDWQCEYIPYHFQRMMGLSNFLSIRVESNSDWTEGLDLSKVGFEDGNSSVVLDSNLSTTVNGQSITMNRSVELGIRVERGKGFFQGITSICLVPRFIIISKLSENIEVRQHGVLDTSTYLHLSLGSICVFHHQFRDRPRLLQIRRYKSIDQTNDLADIDNIWCSEIDISKIGIVYAKLRDPQLILKVLVENVGATLVATISEQSLQWPPYRIDNRTVIPLRIRQTIPTSSKNLFNPTDFVSDITSNIGLGSLPSIETLSDSLNPSNIPWDNLPTDISMPYTWDFPRSGGTILQIEFSQGNTFKYLDINLDEISKSRTMKVLNSFISTLSPSAEGMLLHRESNESWSPLYCMAKGGVIYLCRDESRDDVIGIVNLSKTSSYDLTTKSKYSDIQLAQINKYVDKSAWGDKIITSFGLGNNVSSLNFSSSNPLNIFTSSNDPTKLLIDVNQARVITLVLGEDLGLLQSINTTETGSIHSRHASNDNLSARANDIATLNTSEETTLPRAKVVLSRSSSNENKLTSEGPNITLAQILNEGKTVEQVLDDISLKQVKGAQIVESLIRTGFADNEKLAIQLFQMMINDGIVIKVINNAASEEVLPNQTIPSDIDLKSVSSSISNDAVFDSGTDLSKLDYLSTSVSSNGLEAAGATVQNNSEDDNAFTNLSRSTESLSKSQTHNQSFRNIYENFSQFDLSGNKDDVETIPLAISREPTSSNTTTRNSLFHGAFLAGGLMPTASLGSLPIKTPTKNQPLDSTIYKDGLYRFQVTSLNPELSAFADENKEKSRDEQSDNFRFTITLGNLRHHFKCSSMTQYLFWMKTCRISIENQWIDNLLKRNDNEPLARYCTLESLYTTVSLRVRADGPTKVLEISATDDSNSNDSQVIFSPKKDARHITDALYVTIAVQSLAVSVVDNEPVEVLHLSFEDIEMNIERLRYTVQFAGTVQTITMGNQLLNPLYPLALYPRYHRDSKSIDSFHEGFQRLKLPGLQQKDSKLPSLHLYFQERYHGGRKDLSKYLRSAGPTFKESDEQNASKPTEKEGNLLYFDTFTLWLAPMQLELDEELIARLIRIFQSLRQTLKRSDLGLPSTIREEILSHQHQGFRSWGILDSREISNYYQQYITTDRIAYSSYDIYARPSKGIYFSFLQLHPLDVLVHVRPSPTYQLTTTEMALISIIAQVDSCRICLNALIAEHAFGSVSMMIDVVTKHYRAALWKQFQKLIGSADIVEGSVGLVANLGTGVYDLFYEPIDGLMTDNGSFLDGLSKGGKSLASRTIGGTSAFTSKITGGLGRGVSMLTLDSDFQRLRNSRRLNKATSVSEGLYVGTRELGKNIVDGVTGIVKAPYRGWEEGGGVGFGVGIAKGLLGVALKPAVGVFDLASRATEGLRNVAFSEIGIYDSEGRYIIRKRFPRSFGRHDVIQEYNMERAAAQYVADHLINFKRSPRFYIVHHQHIIRKIQSRFVVDDRKNDSSTVAETNKELQIRTADSDDEIDPVTKPESTIQDGNESKTFNFGSVHPNFRAFAVSHEAWGMSIGNSYIAAVSQERISLFQIKSHRRKSTLDLSFVWSCPANCINELFSDNRGDLILNLSQNVNMTGYWHIPGPIIIDKNAQDYAIFQLILEQTLGLRHARAQVLHPKGGLVDTDVYKRLSTGIRSLVYSPTKHTYQLSGHVLYEYTIPDNSTVKSNDAKGDSENQDQESHSKYPSDPYFMTTINDLFGTRAPTGNSPHYVGSNNTNDDTDESIEPGGYLSFVYPLVNIVVMGPFAEDNNKFSISISNRDPTLRMKALRRESEDSLLSEYSKTILTLVFSTRERALLWKNYLEKHMISPPRDVVDSSVAGGKLLRTVNRSIASSITSNTVDADEPPQNSILGMLVIPTSGLEGKDTEILKIEIAKTLSFARKYSS